jgi:hypothetical protein
MFWWTYQILKPAWQHQQILYVFWYPNQICFLCTEMTQHFHLKQQIHMSELTYSSTEFFSYYTSILDSRLHSRLQSYHDYNTCIIGALMQVQLCLLVHQHCYGALLHTLMSLLGNRVNFYNSLYCPWQRAGDCSTTVIISRFFCSILSSG